MVKTKESKEKKAATIPVRVIDKSKDQSTNKPATPKVDRPKQSPTDSATPKPSLTKHRRQREENERDRKKIFYIVTLITTLVVIGWIFYVKGVVGNYSPDTSAMDEAGQELSETFKSFKRIFSNVQKIDRIESEGKQDAEKFEERIFPQFKESE